MKFLLLIESPKILISTNPFTITAVSEVTLPSNRSRPSVPFLQTLHIVWHFTFHSSQHICITSNLPQQNKWCRIQPITYLLTSKMIILAHRDSTASEVLSSSPLLLSLAILQYIYEKSVYSALISVNSSSCLHSTYFVESAPRAANYHTLSQLY